MRKLEVRVGMKCLVVGHAMGPATIRCEPFPHPHRGRRYQVKVDYLNAPVSYDEIKTRSVVIDLEDIIHEWTASDQEKFDKIQKRIEDQRGWQQELELAGFDGQVHIDHRDKMHLTFNGRAAELVLEKLTGHEIPEEKRGEYIGNRK